MPRNIKRETVGVQRLLDAKKKARSLVYFQETKVNASTYFTSDGSVSTDQLPDRRDWFFLLLFHNYEKGWYKALA